jgi:hypothetical protein
MKPVLAFPYSDPDGAMFQHLQSILPVLKEHFERAYICPPLSTYRPFERIRQLASDDFFTLFPVDREMQIGEHFHYLYQRTADATHPEQIIHLCYLDRIAFALAGGYRDEFLADIDALTAGDLPLIFQRSQFAWDTHPENYRQLEGIVTTVGKNLFGVDLDYAWCHIAVSARQLREIMPLVKNPDLSMVAEMIFYMQDEIKTRDVDWLAWEDPFIFSRDAAELRSERENSLEETNKRLRYILPMIETLTRLSKTKLAAHE